MILGARQAGKDVTPVPPVRRHWEKELENVAEPSKSIVHRVWDNRIFRFGSVIVAAVIVVGLIITSLIGPRQQPQQVVDH